MSTGLIFVIVIAAAAIIYFMFFNESKKAYPENKIKETFESVNKILAPHEDDHRFVISKKETIFEELKIVKKVYSRSPSVYTQAEIDAFEKLLPELKQELRQFCDTLSELKPKIIDLIEAEKNMLQSAKEAMKTSEEVADGSEDAEDVMDIMEKILETSPIKIKEKEDELMKLEKSISRYGSL
ncbi:MAG: hypothetical protein WBJ45_08610 [Limnohabitans sp.]|uniref:hypothetical protein n=1 Tax=Limnohabitans sp. TaxID=1907725 RepID=UPI003BB1A084